MKSNLTLFITTCIALVLYSCAKVGSPSGGPEDDTPPKLILSSPPNETINFTENVIELTFNERITTKSIETNLIITPKPQGNFQARVNKNKIALAFPEGFDDNTTYSFNFGNTILDLTNNNPADNISLSFSTGDYIDSLTVSGTILNLYNQAPIDNLLVSLYPANDTLDILTGSASYYSRTDTSGNYSFRNLPSGNFRLYAARDKNKNRQAESESEAYGFYPDTLRLKESISNINFTVQNLNTKALRKVSSRPFGTYFDIKYNKPITRFTTATLQDIIYDQPATDQIRFYRNKQSFNDSIQLISQATDSIGQVLVDTLSVYFLESKVKPLEFKAAISPKDGTVLPNDSLIIDFNKPILYTEVDSIFFQLDSSSQVNPRQESLTWNSLNTRLSMPLTAFPALNLEPDKQITFTIGKSAFISADNDTSKVQLKTISLSTPSNTAVISGTIQSENEQVIVQLLDPRSLNILRTSTSKIFKFEYLTPGRYMVRVIKDLNQNGKWDIGNLLNWQSPEPAKLYYDSFNKTTIIEVKKNWEQEVNIKL